jgi:hypothetical protein
MLRSSGDYSKLSALAQIGNDPANPDSLGEDNVINLFQDREGDIWAGMRASTLTLFTAFGSVQRVIAIDDSGIRSSARWPA